MSEMEIFHGYFEKSDLNIVPEDTDEFFDLEEEHGCHYVMVDGDLYKFWKSGLNIEDTCGFALVVPPSTAHQLLLYWYNGGAGVHEVASWAIKRWLSEQS